MSDEFHKTVVDNIASGVYYVDRSRRITYWNRGAERITGYDAREVVGRHCYANILAHVDDAGNALCHGACPLAATISDGDQREADVWLRHRDGHRRPVRVRAAAIRDDAGRIVGAVEVFDDATALIEARADVAAARHVALTDPLTELANRRAFDEALAARIQKLLRHGWPFALLLADIDHFKALNDRHGHAAGDRALQVVAASLRDAARAGDLVCRWGGEEFAILVDGGGAASAAAAAERFRVMVARSVVVVDDARLRTTISLGVAVAGIGEAAPWLMGRADAALYAAKAGGRNAVVVSGASGPP